MCTSSLVSITFSTSKPLGLVADPEFPREGRKRLRKMGARLLFWKYFPELYEIEKKLDGKGDA